MGLLELAVATMGTGDCTVAPLAGEERFTLAKLTGMNSATDKAIKTRFLNNGDSFYEMKNFLSPKTREASTLVTSASQPKLPPSFAVCGCQVRPRFPVRHLNSAV